MVNLGNAGNGWYVWEMLEMDEHSWKWLEFADLDKNDVNDWIWQEWLGMVGYCRNGLKWLDMTGYG